VARERPMVEALPHICRFVPRKHESGINFPRFGCVEGMEEIFNSVEEILPPFVNICR
jgi:hypothetical protein